MDTMLKTFGYLGLLVATTVVAGCGSDPEAAAVASKPECIAEVARRLIACGEEQSCEAGVSRYAGYCYNTAAGSQLDICRGGRYFFEQPLQDLDASDPELTAQLNERQREIIIRTGEFYCVYNSN